MMQETGNRGNAVWHVSILNDAPEMHLQHLPSTPVSSVERLATLGDSTKTIPIVYRE